MSNAATPNNINSNDSPSRLPRSLRASQTASQTGLSGMPSPFTPGNSAATLAEALSPDATAFFESVFAADVESSPERLGEDDAMPSYVQVERITTGLVKQGFLNVPEKLGERILADGTPIEEQLLTTTEADLTPDLVMQMIRSNPLLSYLVVGGKSHAQANINLLTYKKASYESNKTLALQFIDWQEKVIKEFRQQAKPTKTKVETVLQEIEDLENQLKKKKQELNVLLPEKAEDDRSIAVHEKNKADAQATYDNASHVAAVCNALVGFLQFIVDAHDNKENKQIELPFANFQSALELGGELGITDFQYFADKDKNWYHLYGTYLYIAFFGYQYSNACRSVFSDFPMANSHTSKLQLQWILCRLCGIPPPETLTLAIRNETIAKNKKRKRVDAGEDFLQELVKKARTEDVTAAKNMEGDFVANLFALHKQGSQGAPNTSSSNENSAGNPPGSTASGPLGTFSDFRC